MAALLAREVAWRGVLASLVVGASLTACGPGDRAGLVDAPPPTATTVTPTEFWTTYARVSCERELACCGLPPPGGSIEECTTLRLGSFSAGPAVWERAVREGAVLWDGAGAARCLTTIEARDCAELQVHWLMHMVPECDYALFARGTGTQGADCSAVKVCADGFECRSDVYQNYTCRAVESVGVGASCAGAISCDGETSFCDGHPIDPRCRARLPDGASCSSEQRWQCASGYCGDDGTCRVRTSCEDDVVI